MLKFKFNKEKAISAVLYISIKLIEENSVNIKPDFHKIFKILYFADIKHLVKYGRPIIGDEYIAMEHGPVPSNIYDMLKIARGDSELLYKDQFSDIFEIRGNHYIYPKKEPDIEDLSETDIECIEVSFNENKEKDFLQLKEESHDHAYCLASKWFMKKGLAYMKGRPIIITKEKEKEKIEINDL